MTALRAVASGLLSRGRISAGWYSILTGLALLLVAYLLGSVRDTDRAAPYVAVVLAVLGVWQLAGGVLELRRGAGPPES